MKVMCEGQHLTISKGVSMTVRNYEVTDGGATDANNRIQEIETT